MVVTTGGSKFKNVFDVCGMFRIKKKKNQIQTIAQPQARLYFYKHNLQLTRATVVDSIQISHFMTKYSKSITHMCIMFKFIQLSKHQIVIALHLHLSLSIFTPSPKQIV